MSHLPTFGAYAAAFEESLLDDDWVRLERFFSSDAVYRPGDGTQAIGRDAVLQAFQDSVNDLERKCDGREALSQPEVSESRDTVTLKFKARYRKKGLPDLILSGYETVQFSGSLIRRMEDVFDVPSALFDWRAKL